MTRSSKASSKAAEKPSQTPVELVNPGTAGIVYDEAGHSVGGGSRATLDGDPDPVAMRQLRGGHLLAQRGDVWLVVRDGKLVDPHAARITGAGSTPEPTAVPEPREGTGTTTE